MTIKCIAIIPARGGSKRLPRKNILPINNQPMMTYPIQVAIDSGLFDDVVVSTEDDEIANIASKSGATVVVRPNKLAEDVSTVVEVCAHVLGLKQYREVDVFCCIYATAIFLTPGDLVEACYELNEEPVADYVMGVSQYNYHPVQALRKESDFLTSMWPEYQVQQSQQYPNLVVSNGTLYWARKRAFVHDCSFYGERLKGFCTESVDIDTQEDYKQAIKMAVEKTL